MTKQEFYNRLPIVIEKAKFILSSQAPIKTGNLQSSYKVENKSKRSYTIFVDETQAPYMKYTNEPWVNREVVNPNVGHFDDAIHLVLQLLQQEFGGTQFIVKDEKDGE